MSQEVTPFEGKNAIVMRNKLVHWVSAETGEKLQQQLVGQQAHSFIKLKELGLTINSADVSGVYTVQQYEDMQKIEQGMRQCTFGKWHGRREECQCAHERRKAHDEAMRRAAYMRDNRELTDEERAASLKKIKEIGDEFRAKGFLKGRDVLTGKHDCIMCTKRCPEYSRYYCSGECIKNAKDQGIYGREEEYLASLINK